MLAKVLCILPRDKTFLSIVKSKGTDNEDAIPLIKNAINQNNEEAIRFLLDMIHQERTSFHDVVQTMKICFQDLWIHYNNLMQPLIKHDALSRVIGHAQLPSRLCPSIRHSSTIARTTNMAWTFHHEQTEENLLKLLGLSLRGVTCRNGGYMQDWIKGCSPLLAISAFSVFCVQNPIHQMGDCIEMGEYMERTKCRSTALLFVLYSLS